MKGLDIKQKDWDEVQLQEKEIHVDEVKEVKDRELVQVSDHNLKVVKHHSKRDCLSGEKILIISPITFKEVNLTQVLHAISRGLIDPNEPITIKVMRDAGIFKRTRFGVKLLGRGSFGFVDKLKEMGIPALNFEVSDASEWAIKAIKEAGGSVKCIYRTPLLLREHLKPEKYDLQLRDPLPPAYVMKQFQRMEARGAEVTNLVIYNKPRWVQEAEQIQMEPVEEVQKQEQAPAELSAKEQRKQKKKGTSEKSEVTLVEESVKNLTIPANREEGCGRTKIRRRKQKLQRQISYKL